MLKKTILAALMGTTLLASNAAFADRDHYKVKHYPAKHYVEYRPVQRHYYQPAPMVVHREVIVHRPVPVYYQPAPVYYQSYDPSAGLVVAGALIGGAIAWHIVNGY